MKNPPVAATVSNSVVPVAIYTRVSTDNQVGGRFDSLESQATICRDFIGKRAADGWHEVACFTDAAYSGGTMDRPGIRALKRQIEAGEVKVVLIYKLERVLRSTDEWVPFRAFLLKHSCRLESATEDLSEATASGRLKNNVLMSVAEYERQNTAEKTRAKMEQQAKKGYWNGGMVPFGYSYDEKSQTLNPDPVDAPIVRRIFEHAANLGSLTELANTLNGEGRRTKERIFNRREGSQQTVGGRLFRSDGLRLIVRNVIYRGAVKFAGQEYAARHESLVPPELWERANAAVSKTETRAADLVAERDRHTNLLKGLAWCGHCQRAMIPHQSGKPNATGKPYRYYYCGYVMRERRPDACAVGRLSADGLERAVIGFLSEVGKHPTLITGVVDESRSRNRGDRQALQADLEQTEAALKQTAGELSNCVDAVAKGGVDVLGDALTRRVQELRSQHQQLMIECQRRRQALAACETAIYDEQRIRQSIEQLGTLLPRLSPEERKELVRLFVLRVELRNPKARTRQTDLRDVQNRRLALKIKLSLPELVQGVEAREQLSSGWASRQRPVAPRGVSFDARVDFTEAMHGEVTILTPFQQVFRTGAAVPRRASPEPKVQHAIVRARKWQQMLDAGKVANRVALAKQLGVTPGAVTRILKLLEVSPDIQRFLESLNTKEANRHFTIKKVGELAGLPQSEQLFEFGKMRAAFTQRVGVP